MRWIAKNENELSIIVPELWKEIKFPIVLFKGDLGAGKTTFIRSLLNYLGTKDRVSSPTFSLVNEYEIEKGIVYHFDFYRIEDEEEAFDMGAEEYFYSGNYCFIEWPEKIESLIPAEHHTVTINVENEDRLIKLDE